MSIDNKADSARNPENSNSKLIYLDELVPYATKPNARIRVFFEDDQTPYRYGRDGFISLSNGNFCVEFDARHPTESPYKLKQHDIIGIPNGPGFENRIVSLYSKKK